MNRKENKFVFSTNIDLLNMANRIDISPQRNCSVFYHGAGGVWASEFMRKNPERKLTRLNEVVKSSEEGRRLWAALVGAYDGTKEERWAETAEVWYTLSARMAENSSGDVFAFGDIPSRQNPEKNKLGGWESKHQPHYFANTVFEKVELPILEVNENVEYIYYNGKALR